MPAAPKTRRRFFPWLLLVILPAALAAVYFSLWHGSDAVCSAALSRALGVPTQVDGVRWDSLRQLRFKRAVVSGLDTETLLLTGPGRLRWTLGDPFFSQADVSFSDALIGPSLLKGFLGQTPVAQAAFFSSDMRADDAFLAVRRSGAYFELRVLSLNAKGFQAQGGFRWKDGSLDTAHLMLRVSQDLLKDVPTEWLDRLPLNSQEQRLIKCSFHNGQLTLFGRSGPMLRASWEMAYTTSP